MEFQRNNNNKKKRAFFFLQDSVIDGATFGVGVISLRAVDSRTDGGQKVTASNAICLNSLTNTGSGAGNLVWRTEMTHFGPPNPSDD